MLCARKKGTIGKNQGIHESVLMTLNAYLWGMKVSTAIAFFTWAAVILYVDPREARSFGMILFGLTLFLWLSGAVALCMMWVRRKVYGDERAAKALGASLRQGIFLSGYCLVLLGMQYARVLAWWDALLAAVALLLVELRFIHASSAESREVGTQTSKLQRKVR